MHGRDIYKFGEEILDSIYDDDVTGKIKNTIKKEIKKSYNKNTSEKTPFYSIDVKKSRGILKIIFGALIIFYFSPILAGILFDLRKNIFSSASMNDFYFLLFNLIILGTGGFLVISGIKNRIL